jgi:hypothetical protein
MDKTLLKAGQVVLIDSPFTSSSGHKLRPALIIYSIRDDVIILPITSNLNSDGILITKKEGAAEDSMIKLNNIFTIYNSEIKHVFFELTKEKKREVYVELIKRFSSLIE